MSALHEVGDEFHWLGTPQEPLIDWPKPSVFFSMGRVAASQVWRQCLPSQDNRRLWLPDYFCQHTAEYWRRSGIELRHYADHPALLQPHWDTLTPDPGDIVLAINYFGIRSSEPWKAWHAKKQDIVLLEDHTHDPFSTWASNSQADYAFASLRKVFASPDGAIIWSPQNGNLPSESQGKDWNGSALKLAAMVWKAEYFRTGEKDSALKRTFHQLQSAGEQHLERSPDQQLSPWSHALLTAGYPAAWRRQREENVRNFLARLPVSEHFKSLFTNWPDGHCPFNAILVTKTAALRERLRKFLITADIYSTVHWQLPETTSAEAFDLSRRILTIPVDQRYGLTEIERIAGAFSDFISRTKLR